MTDPEPGATRRTDEAFLRRLVAAHPVLQPILDEHVDDGGLLPHVLLPVIGSWVEERGPDDPEARRVVADVDAALGEALELGDEDVENVIAVSFLEFWPRPPLPGGEWRGRFPERLAAMLSEMDAYRPGG